MRATLALNGLTRKIFTRLLNLFYGTETYVMVLVSLYTPENIRTIEVFFIFSGGGVDRD